MKDKYINVVYNQNIFQTDKFGEKTFEKISNVDWLPINVKNQFINYYSV